LNYNTDCKEMPADNSVSINTMFKYHAMKHGVRITIYFSADNLN